MAGILANSATVTMTSGIPDAIVGGYITNESITLTTEPAGGVYLWGLSKPQGSSDRANLTSTDGAMVNFVPDVQGFWAVTCIVDGVTIYLIRLGVAAVAVTTHGDASRYIPIGNATVPAPALGATLFYSRDDDRLSIKLADGTVLGIATV